jgi:hypothetical protein
VISRQDRLLRPEQLRVEDGHLIFHEENQAVCHWAVAGGDHGADAQVVCIGQGDVYETEETLSEFLARRVVTEAALRGDRVVEATDARLAALARRYAPLDFGRGDPTSRLLGDPDTLMLVGPTGFVHANARTETSLSRLRALLG